MKWEPKKYMEKAVGFAVERACAGLFLDPGLGKTAIMLAVYKLLKGKKQTRGALVICPLRVAFGVWPKEIQKWDDFKRLKVVVLHGPNKAKLFQQQSDIYVVNFDGLKWLYDTLAKVKGDWPFDILIVDESSKLKNMRSERSKLLRPMLAAFRRRYILTGSPAPNGLLDLFGQMYILDQGKTLGWWYTQYRDKYFYPSGYGGYTWKLKHGSEKKVHSLLKPRVLRMDAEDYLTLPKKFISDVWVELPKDAMLEYRRMENLLIADMKAGRVTAANSGVASMKCRQIAGGAVFKQEIGEKRTWLHVHDEKLEALQELLDELQGQPVMVIYEFEHELTRFQGMKFFKQATVIANTPAHKIGKIEDAWNAGDIPYLLCHPASMGHGLNLQEAGQGQIWFTPTYDFVLYDQTIRRMWRQGRKTPLFIYRILARNTVDIAVINALSSKGKTQGALNKALRDYWIKRVASGELADV